MLQSSEKEYNGQINLNMNEKDSKQYLCNVVLVDLQ